MKKAIKILLMLCLLTVEVLVYGGDFGSDADAADTTEEVCRISYGASRRRSSRRRSRRRGRRRGRRSRIGRRRHRVRSRRRSGRRRRARRHRSRIRIRRHR